ncbi:MAG TPA: UDP-N-acetylglucosamine--LPS N-acetylglucosamine transferase [Verrucomicrobiae bacterium]|nr:UDP-N-acetylglucosamine--LPS N-acetylglucosamine transferase [Verrucomicrobiae bacterium]
MRVLILSSSTGGGHDMRARAFQAWAQLAPELNLEAQVHRPLDEGPGLYRFGVGLYNWIQKSAPRLHHVYFNFLEVAAPCRSARGLLGAKQFCETLDRMRPDVLLSVHGTLNHGYFDCARNFLGRDKVRCVTYCGELFGGYGFSRNWVNPDADLFIGAVPETCVEAARFGMPTDKNCVGGFLLRPEFYDLAPDDAKRRDHIRNQLGFNPDEFILLLSASSRGANNHIIFLEAMRGGNLDVQTVVLCGKSVETEARIANWQKQNPKSRVRILPHDTNVAMLLRSVSAVVARPGTGATSEAILSQCPLLLNCLGGAMPQECITVKFCRKHQLAETIQRPADLARLVSTWTKNPEICAGVRQRMLAACPPGHPRDILRRVAGLA